MNDIQQAIQKKLKLRGLIKPLLILFGVATLLFVVNKFFNAQQLLEDALDWIDTLGPWGPIAFTIIYILATVLFLPGSLLTLGAGFLFGPLSGSIYVSIGSTIGATCAFLVGRYLARGWVSKKIAGNEQFKAIDQFKPVDQFKPI